MAGNGITGKVDNGMSLKPPVGSRDTKLERCNAISGGADEVDTDIGSKFLLHKMKIRGNSRMSRVSFRL